MNEEDESTMFGEEAKMPMVDQFEPTTRPTPTTTTTTGGGPTPQLRLVTTKEEVTPHLGSDDPYNDTPEAKASLQELLKKMLFSEKKGQGTVPTASLSKRLGYNLSKPAQDAVGVQNGYYDEGPSQQLINRTVDGVQQQMDAAVPTMSQRLPYRAEKLKYYYSHQLATKDDHAKGLYNPISANPFQRMAYIMKQRLREFSLYNRD